MDRYDTVIIGGGLAGLSCAIALLKEGHKVCVLEQGKALGGAFQSYMRDEMRLDAGFHYVGGVGKGEGMRPLIDYFGLGDLPWKAMDEKFMEVKLRERPTICIAEERHSPATWPNNSQRREKDCPHSRHS